VPSQFVVEAADRALAEAQLEKLQEVGRVLISSVPG
jgi:hypothetical protein